MRRHTYRWNVRCFLENTFICHSQFPINARVKYLKFLQSTNLIFDDVMICNISLRLQLYTCQLSLRWTAGNKCGHANLQVNNVGGYNLWRSQEVIISAYSAQSQRGILYIAMIYYILVPALKSWSTFQRWNYDLFVSSAYEESSWRPLKRVNTRRGSIFCLEIVMKYFLQNFTSW